MADPTPPRPSAGPSPSNPASTPPQGPKTGQNPALRMLGLPNLRLKLPSRNWLIFWTVTGSFAGAILYDNREKKRAQQKWSNLVAHISRESLPNTETRRKLTIFLAAPPGDGLRSAREHFVEYVKPILVSAALDYEVLEGRREGDIRAALANRIRKERRRAGEGAPRPEDAEDVDSQIQSLRQNLGIREEGGPRGDLVIGRHTWKEYIRGLHEGWLGPLDPPPPPSTPEVESLPTQSSEGGTFPTDETTGTPALKEDGEAQGNKDTASVKEEKKDEKPKAPEKPKKLPPTPAYILPAGYESAQPPPTIPHEFQPSSPVPFPHLLGFLNTPIRIYRFLTERYLADSIGREVAAIVLASATRPYSENVAVSSNGGSGSSDEDASPSSSSPSPHQHLEQYSLLNEEEKDWHKSVRKPPQDPESVKEREWLDDVVIDPRIGSRMRRFILPPEEEERAARISAGKEWIKGEEKPPHVPVYRRLWEKYGWGTPDPRANVVLGNIDDEDA